MKVDPSGLVCRALGPPEVRPGKRGAYQKADPLKPGSMQVRVYGFVYFVAKVVCDDCSEAPRGFGFYQWIESEAKCPNTASQPPVNSPGTPDNPISVSGSSGYINNLAQGPLKCECGLKRSSTQPCPAVYLYFTVDLPGYHGEKGARIEPTFYPRRCDVDLVLTHLPAAKSLASNIGFARHVQLRIGFGQSEADAKANSASWGFHIHAGAKLNPNHVVPILVWE